MQKQIKTVFIGDILIGKTSIINRAARKSFEESYSPTITPTSLSFQIESNSGTKIFSLWDSAGSEKFKDILQLYVKNSSLILYCFDLTNKSSFDNLNKWIDLVNQILLNEEYFFAIIGNKSDLINERQITFEEGQRFADSKGCFYFEVSAKTGEGIDSTFTFLSNQSIEEKDGLILDASPSQKQSCNC